MKWLQEKLIPNLESKSVIVVDNASYHNVQFNRHSTSNARKGEMLLCWLPTSFASFPFSSPPVRHRVPSGSKCPILQYHQWKQCRNYYHKYTTRATSRVHTCAYRAWRYHRQIYISQGRKFG